jgi:hypothetical protein
MPGFLLTTGSTVNCSHGGTATPTTPNARVRADGQPTTQQPMPWVVAGCTLVAPAPGPDATATWVTGSVRVRSNGMPLLLMDSTATALPSANPLLIVQSQVRVRAT